MTRSILVLYSVVTCFACGRSADYDVILRGELAVAPLVAETAAWNAYVADDALELIDLSGAPCTSPTSYRSCVPAGTLRRVDSPRYTSCANLSLSDSLGVFTWDCAVRNGSVTFFSTGLRQGHGLRDLIDFTALRFRTMHVTVHDASTGADTSTRDQTWWNDPISALADSSDVVQLADADTIYAIDDNVTAAGIDIVADGVALVTAPGTRLTYAGTGSTRCSGYRILDASEPATQCLVTGTNTSRLWIEADIGATDVGAYHMVFDHVTLLRMNAVTMGRTTANAGVKLADVTASWVSDVRIAQSESFFVIRGGSNLLQDLRLAATGVFLDATRANVFDRVTAFGRFAGIDIHGDCVDNRVARLVSFSHSGSGVQLTGAGNVGNTLAGFTIADTQATGLGLWTDAQTTTVHLGLIANAGEHGAGLQGSATAVSHLASLANEYTGVVLDAPGANQRFSGMLVVGDANGYARCALTDSPTNPGLTESCAPQGLSPSSLVTVTTSVAIADTFVGLVTTDDPENTSDDSGRAVLTSDTSSLDLLGASSMYRGWGRSGTSFLADDERSCPGDGTCWVASESTTVQLFDWSLRAASVANLATSDTAADFADGATCPAAVQGDRVAYDMHDGERLSDGVGNDDGVCEPGEDCDGNTYLLAALEIIGDRRGDDDGLCESDEACIVAPNFGAYQGDGNYAEHQCVFADGVVHGVTMFGYPVNGR